LVAASTGTLGVSAGCAGVFGIESERYVVADAQPEGSQGQDAPAVDDAPPVEAGPSDAGADAPGPWDCVSAPNMVLDPSLRVQLTLTVTDGVQQTTSAGSIDGGSDLEVVAYTPMPGVQTRYCSILDPQCTNPSAWVTTDDAGNSLFQVNGDFKGFFQLSRSDLWPSFYYVANLPHEPTQHLSIGGLNEEAAKQLAQAIGTNLATDPDGGLGSAFASMYDCFDHHGGDVALTFSPLGSQGTPFYMNNGFPDPRATATDTALGTGGVMNVPAGTVNITATLVSTHTVVGTAQIVVRSGAATFVNIRPRTH
jgi:hypothetical protein